MWDFCGDASWGKPTNLREATLYLTEAEIRAPEDVEAPPTPPPQ